MAFIYDHHVPQPTIRHAKSTAPEPDCAFIILRVNTENRDITHGIVRQHLGGSVENYTAQDNPHTGRSTFKIKTTNSALDTLMHQIMINLPEAEFGEIMCGSSPSFLIQ